ncbi:MAG: hypothetical protein MJZ37_10595, partial [Bacilli bacterium]|nr:hypothetical protein [Bacilli bacterium]
KEKGLPVFNPEKRGSSIPTKSGYLSDKKQGSQSTKLSTKSGSKSDKDYIRWYNHYMEAIPMMDNLDLYKKLITTSSTISESEKRAFNDAMNSLGKRGKNR